MKPPEYDAIKSIPCNLQAQGLISVWISPSIALMSWNSHATDLNLNWLEAFMMTKSDKIFPGHKSQIQRTAEQKTVSHSLSLSSRNNVMNITGYLHA
jgi:hypothetical protein